MIDLRDHQAKAVEDLDNGNILYGGVGAGKSRTVVAYYMEKEAPKDVYVITTAKKRDSLDWQGEFARVGVGTEGGPTLAGTLHVDSWNNVSKYTHIRGAFFIFDEQRVVGTGVWAKSFIKIAKLNRWVLLSATPGDTWLDYAPVFIANGFYENITDFKRKHVVYEPFAKFPKVKMYLNERKLQMLRNQILVEMPYDRHTERIMNWLDVGYDVEHFKEIIAKRWHPWEDRPIKDAAELGRVLRRIVNSDPSRLQQLFDICRWHKRVIIFYNWDYELKLLRKLYHRSHVGEWNGHRKTPIPDTERWVYLVQYLSGAEGWNCRDTNAMVFYSLTSSYKIFEQCMGRIDRMDTLYTQLYYYMLVSNSFIDRGNRASLDAKKDFNERRYVEEYLEFGAFQEERAESCEI